MLKSLIIVAATLTAFAAHAITEQEYLAKNKTYTDGLLSYLSTEDKNNKQLETFKAQKKTTESDLKKANTTLATTSKQLGEKETLLASLKQKELNKVQLESDLNTQKQQNLNKISSLNGQISNVSGQVQSVEFEISKLENDKTLIQQKVNTQEQLVKLAKNNINNLEWDIQLLQNEIQNNDFKISNLKSDINSLQIQKGLETDPLQKQIIQNQIDNKKSNVQQLNQENNIKDSQVNSKQLQVINEKSQMNQAQSTLNSLNIQLNGKQSEISSQVNLLNQLQGNLNNLQAQQSTLVKKNKSIDAELDLLSNLPLHISNAEQAIVALSAQKTQNETSVNTLTTQLSAVSSMLTQLQAQVDADKAAVLASEKDHDTVLKDFLASVVATPVVTPTELQLSIDSITVTEQVAQSKDWTVFKGASTTLGANVCAASTRVLDATTGVLSELLVVKMVNADGSYSSPFVATTHSMIPNFVVKGQLKTDKSKSLVMPLLQSPVANEKALISRYSDTAKLISSLKADNSTKVEFTVPGSSVIVPFSLRGSSAMINEFLSKCAN